MLAGSVTTIIVTGRSLYVYDHSPSSGSKELATNACRPVRQEFAEVYLLTFFPQHFVIQAGNLTGL